MNNQDYEKAKQGCWRMLWREFFYDESKTRPVDREDVFNFTFNRAYRLGMEAAKKDMLTANVDSLEGKHTEPQEDKDFDNIIRDSFRGERRLNIAATILQGMLSNFSVDTIKLRTDLHIKLALGIADALIEESQKGGSK